MSEQRADEQRGREETHYEDADAPPGQSLSSTPSRSPQKSKANLSRKRSRASDRDGRGESAAKSAEPQVEPIVATVGGPDDLRDGYYRDLRALLPPPCDPRAAEEGCTAVDGMLRAMHDAADEIDRALRPPLTLLHRPTRSPDDGSSRRGPAENARKLSRRGRRRKPDDAARVRMKIYRVEAMREDDDDDDDWTAAAAELSAADDGSGGRGSATSSSGPRADLGPSDAHVAGVGRDVPSSTGVAHARTIR